MEKALEFSCPICGSLCQTTTDMIGREFECLICMSEVIVPAATDEPGGLDIQYFVKAGVVRRNFKEGFAEEGVTDEQEAAAEPAKKEDPQGYSLASEVDSVTERLLFRETVEIDGNKIPLAISTRKVDIRGLPPILVNHVCGLKLNVSQDRSSVTSEIEYVDKGRDVTKCRVTINRKDPAKVKQVVAEFLAALRQVRRPGTKIELVDDHAPSGANYWDDLPS